jgi:hypothetical protein
MPGGGLLDRCELARHDWHDNFRYRSTVNRPRSAAAARSHIHESPTRRLGGTLSSGRKPVSRVIVEDAAVQRDLARAKSSSFPQNWLREPSLRGN